MIQTSDEGTSFCPQCEQYARQIEKLKAVAKAAQALIYAPRPYLPGSKKANLKAALDGLAEPIMAKVVTLTEPDEIMGPFIPHKEPEPLPVAVEPVETPPVVKPPAPRQSYAKLFICVNCRTVMSREYKTCRVCMKSMEDAPEATEKEIEAYGPQP